MRSLPRLAKWLTPGATHLSTPVFESMACSAGSNDATNAMSPTTAGELSIA
jgi:hypothetical protein